MSNAYITGFTKRAQEAGLSAEQAQEFLKKALDMDPASMANAGAPGPGAGGPPDLSAGGPPPGAGAPPPGGDPNGAPQSTGIPPEIEQLIQQLPPEVLQQLLQEIEAEMGAQGGAGGGAGGPPPGMPPGPGAGAPPPGADPSQGMMPPKQGSILAKEASYIQGFSERALSYGFDKTAAEEMYKKALEIMEGAQTADAQKEKQAAHFEGFMSQAKVRGISQDEALAAYRQTFGK